MHASFPSRLLCLPALAGLALAVAAPAQAYTVTLDFSGDICGSASFSACADGDVINPRYGDIAGVLDVSYRVGAAAGDTTLANALNRWSTGFGNGVDVAYASAANAYGQIAFTPLQGTRLTLTGVQLVSRTANAYSYLTVGVQPDPTTPNYWFTLFSANVNQSADFDLQIFGNQRPLLVTWGNAVNTGIDRITLEVSPVPEPSSLAMALAGIGLLGIARRCRRPR